MDYRTDFKDLSKPGDAAKLSSVLAELADSLDVLSSTTAPNGNISGRQGQICLYNNSGTYTVWVNTTGSTVWQQVDVGGMQYTDTRHYTSGFTRDVSLASGTQIVTGVGFSPKTVFLNACIAGTSAMSIGMDSVSGAQVLLDEKGVAGTYNTTSGYSIFIETSDGVQYLGVISSRDSDGSFTITWTKVGSPTGILTVSFTALR